MYLQCSLSQCKKLDFKTVHNLFCHAKRSVSISDHDLKHEFRSYDHAIEMCDYLSTNHERTAVNSYLSPSADEDHSSIITINSSVLSSAD